MSTCISSEGEYSEHALTLDPDDFREARWTCARCFAVDVDALLDSLGTARAAKERLRRMHKEDRRGWRKTAREMGRQIQQAEAREAALREGVRALAAPVPVGYAEPTVRRSELRALLGEDS